VLICFTTVYLRYAFGVGLIWLQEAYIWTHAAAILLGSGLAFLSGSFISVDLFFKSMSPRARALVTLVGSIFFLLPFLWFMGSTSWYFFTASYQMNEGSAYEDGLPATYLLKGMLLVFVFVIALQWLAQILDALKSLRGSRDGVAAR
jgi:TRAP-type mannitol/chloroaromatic compound transport system permease small subunit